MIALKDAIIGSGGKFTQTFDDDVDVKWNRKTSITHLIWDWEQMLKPIEMRN